MTQLEREKESDRLLETWRNGNKNDMRRSLESLSTADAVSVAALMLENTKNRQESLSLVESMQYLKG